MRPVFMLTTELISIPTGFIYLVALGTFWKAKIQFTVPMLFALGMYFNFLIGGISGVFLSDVPADTTEHGSFFVMAHFHYTIMGGLIFAFMGGLYYWLPKMMGIKLNQTLGKIHFWTMFIFFNSTFLPLFAIGMAGQPRRVFEYARNLETLNDWVSISSFLLGGVDPDLRDQLRLVDRVRPGARGRATRGDPAAWSGRSRRRRRPATSPRSRWCCPARIDYGVPGRAADGRPVPAGRRAERRLRRARDSRSGGIAMAETSRSPAAGPDPGGRGGGLLPRGGAERLVDRGPAGHRRPVVRRSARSCSPTSTCGRSTRTACGTRPGFKGPQTWAGTVVMALVVVSAAVQTAALQRIKAGPQGRLAGRRRGRAGARPGARSGCRSGSC